MKKNEMVAATVILIFALLLLFMSLIKLIDNGVTTAGTATYTIQ
jgi:hypothetical protein